MATRRLLLLGVAWGLAVALSVGPSDVPTARAADVISTWLGNPGNWSDPSRWDSAEFPDNGNGGFTYDAVIGVIGNVTVDQDIMIEGLTFSVGTLTGPADFTLTINESMTWTNSGIMTGLGTTVIGPDGTLTLTVGDGSGSGKHLRRLLVNEGETTWTSGNVFLQNGTFQNDGLFTASGGTSFSSNSAGSVNTFQNNGTFVKQGTGSATFSFNVSNSGVTFNNAGAVDVQQGTLNLQNGGAHTGSFTGLAGTTLTFGGSHTFAVGADMTGGMNIEFNSGVMTIDSAIATTGSLTFTGTGNKTFNGPVSAGALHLSGSVVFNDSLSAPSGSIAGGSLTGPAEWTVTDTLTWAGGMMAGAGTTTIAPDATLSLSGSVVRHLRRLLVNEGTTIWHGTLALQDNATFQNDGLFIASGGGSFTGNPGSNSTNTFQNNGAFVKQVVSTTSFAATGSGVTFNNAGTVDVQAGMLDLQFGGTHTGSFTGSAGTTVRFNGNHTFAVGADMTGGMNIRFDTGVMTIDSEIATTGTLTSIGYSSVSPGTKTFNGPVSAGSLHLSTYSGSVVFNDTLSAPGGSIAGGSLTGSADWTVTDTLTWENGGIMAGAGTTTIAPDATLSLGGGLSGERHLRRLLVNKGTTTWTSGDVALQDNATFQNDGLFIASTWTSFNSNAYGSTNTFQNNGTFLKQGTSTTVFSSSGGGVKFNNAGTVDIQAGTLVLQYGGTHTGSFTGSEGTTLKFVDSHTFAAGADTTGGMNIEFNSGVMTVNSEIATTGSLTFVGSGNKTFNGPVSVGAIHLSTNGDDVVFNDSLSAPVGTFSRGGLTGSANWTVTDTLTWTHGTMAGEGTTVIGSGATFTLSGRGGERYLRRLLVNQGETIWTGGGASSSSLIMQNGTFQNDGLFTANLSFSSSFSGSSDGISTNTFQNNGTFVKQGANTVTFSATSSRGVTFNNAGTVDVQAGMLDLQKGGTHTGSFTGSVGATLRFSNDHTFAMGADVTGGMNVQFGLGVMTVESEIATTGSLTLVGTGNKTLNGPVSAGSLHISGATAIFNDSLSAPGGSLSNGTLSGSADWTVTDTLIWTYGTMTGTGTTTIAAGANLSLSGSDFITRHLRRLLVNEGTIQWTGGQEWAGSNLAMHNGTIQNNGLFTANSNSPLTFNSNSAGSVNTFHNNGTFTKQGTATATFSATNGGVTFNNAGIVDVQEGTLSLQGAITQLSGSTLTDGTWNVRNGATLTFPSGRNVLINEASVELDGPNASFPAINSISANAGRFSIVGGRKFITAGDFHNSGDLNVGEQSSLLVNGNYLQDPDASLMVEIGRDSAGEQYSPVSVAGAATLGGTLDVLATSLGGELFAPQVGDAFIVLSVSGGLGGTTFDTINFPTRIGAFDYEWTTTYSINEVLLEVTAVSLSGDFNLDGVVDAIDYTVWRNGLGTDYTIDDYHVWRDNYGATALGGPALTDVLAAVPEPASALTFACAAFLLATALRQHNPSGVA